jgi:hypothetical protein
MDTTHALRVLNNLLWAAISAVSTYYALESNIGWAAIGPATGVLIFLFSAVGAYQATGWRDKVDSLSIMVFGMQAIGMATLIVLLLSRGSSIVPLPASILMVSGLITSTAVGCSYWQILSAKKQMPEPAQ